MSAAVPDGKHQVGPVYTDSPTKQRASGKNRAARRRERAAREQRADQLPVHPAIAASREQAS